MNKKILSSFCSPWHECEPLQMSFVLITTWVLVNIWHLAYLGWHRKKRIRHPSFNEISFNVID